MEAKRIERMVKRTFWTCSAGHNHQTELQAIKCSKRYKRVHNLVNNQVRDLNIAIRVVSGAKYGVLATEHNLSTSRIREITKNCIKDTKIRVVSERRGLRLPDKLADIRRLSKMYLYHLERRLNTVLGCEVITPYNGNRSDYPKLPHQRLVDYMNGVEGFDYYGFHYGY